MAPRNTMRSGWKIFLSPSWIITTILVVAFSYLAFTVLSPWQLGKDHDIVERNERIEESFQTDPVAYPEVFTQDGAIRNDDLEWRRVELHGHYLLDKEVLLRMRSVSDTPNYQALTPFQLDSGEIILVHRGYVPTDTNTMPQIPAAPRGEQTIIGVARHTENKPNTAPMEADGRVQVYGINTAQIAELIDEPLGTDYLQLLADEPGVLTPMPIPKLDRGNHLSYGFQWIAFGIMAPLGLGYFVWSEIRERRRAQEELAEMSGVESQESPAVVEADPASASESSREAKLRSRYGTSRHNEWARRH